MTYTEQAISKKIGWDGKSLYEMLTESEELFRKTGKYYGLEELPLKEKDPIRFEKIFSMIRGGLVNARETALNISASPIVKEIGELCFALYTPEGDSVALSTGIIVHVHTMSEAIKYMIRNHYEENPQIRPGDIFGNNDASIVGNVHNADFHTIVPIFYKNELICWAGGVTHELDVGAIYPGSMPFGQTSRFEDGFIVTCEKIGENDELYKSYLKRAESSVRAERYWLLDERTRVAGCHMIRDQVYRIIEEEGIDTFKQFLREVIEEGRRSFKANVKEKLIPGRYEAATFIDVPFANEKEIARQARKDLLMHAPMELVIDGDGGFHISFEGANKWGYHSFNCPPTALQGALWVQLTQSLICNDKVNDGAYFASSLHLPKGSWCNPDDHLVSTTVSWYFMIPALNGVVRSLSRAYFSRGYLEEVTAGYPYPGNVTMGGGPNQYGVNSAFTNFEMSCQGTGAMYMKDGEATCAAMWNPEGDMGDIESWELIEPLLYLARGIKPNSAGHGKFRGGMGLESTRMIWKTSSQVIYNMGEGHVFCGAGIFGGYPGNSGYRLNIHGTNLKELIENKKPYPLLNGDPENSEMNKLVQAREVVFDKKALACAQDFEEYDLYISVQRGGPGLGDPIERDPKLVEQDLNEGYLIPRYAPVIYGVIAEQDEDGIWHVDLDKTEARRKEIRQERLAKAIPVSEFILQERQRIIDGDLIQPVKEMYQSSFELSDWWKNKFIKFWNLDENFTFDDNQ